eukprot:scaffold112016_cov33-Phaeocystis_antarctica.AAC.1
MPLTGLPSRRVPNTQALCSCRIGSPNIGRSECLRLSLLPPLSFHVSSWNAYCLLWPARASRRGLTDTLHLGWREARTGLIPQAQEGDVRGVGRCCCYEKRAEHRVGESRYIRETQATTPTPDVH